MSLNINDNSTIEKRIEGKNYKGIFGKMQLMSISDDDNEDQILFSYTKQLTPALIFFYKKPYQSLYLFIVNANAKNAYDPIVTEELINLFNLE